ncbi:hypothetical protein BDN72DRAFT_292463 [Pluteus cervinus]|uniref:Uncharacterized protein n=1 Tax=Pluteus cervinus TaxID=181527 RepID=A0ACD3ADU9_9AGAR|nr:hypothetical protein BDN72DRAFT_292463 [Pluteus cervinus]
MAALSSSDVGAHRTGGDATCAKHRCRCSSSPHSVFSASCRYITSPTLFPPLFLMFQKINRCSLTRPRSAGNGFRAGMTTTPWLLTGSGRAALRLEYLPLFEGVFRLRFGTSEFGRLCFDNTDSRPTSIPIQPRIYAGRRTLSIDDLERHEDDFRESKSFPRTYPTFHTGMFSFVFFDQPAFAMSTRIRRRSAKTTRDI